VWAILGLWEGQPDEAAREWSVSRPIARAGPPLFVALDATAARALRTEAEGAGWPVVDDPALAARGRLVMIGDLLASGVATCIEAALTGAGLLVASAEASPELLDELLEDLSRIGRPVIAGRHDVYQLDVTSWRLLHALRDGATVSEASRALHLSLRTANRRLAQARTALGATTRGELLRAVTRAERIPPAPA
jgi:DNA-binding NarL/FixJ family response regulator